MRQKSWLGWLVAFMLGILGTTQYHLNQFTTRFDTFFGDRGDARGFVYFLEHWYQSFRGEADLLSPGIFYPVKGTLAFSDLLLGFAIPYSFFRTLGFSMFSATEIVVILLTFLTYCACFVLLYRVLRFRLLPSCLGAMFFAFNSPKFFQTGHLQLQFVICLPLIVMCIVLLAQNAGRLSQTKAAVLLCLAALMLQLQLLTAFYHAWFFVFWSVLFLLLAMIVKESRGAIIELLKKYRAAIGFSAAFTFISFVPFLLVYVPAVKAGTWYPYEYVTEMIPEWWSLLSMGDGNYIWGRVSAAVMPDPPPATWGELKIGIGLIPSLAWIAITVWALLLVGKRSTKLGGHAAGEIRATGRIFLAVAILATTLFYFLAFKYNGYSPWFFVYHSFPGAGAIRAVSRYVIFLSLPMSIAFAYSLNRGQQWLAGQKSLRGRTALTVALFAVAGFGVFEQFGVFKVGGTGFSKRAEENYLRATAAKLPADCKAFYIAAGQGNHNAFEYQYDAMLISIMSGIPTLNASSSQFPKDWSLYLLKDPDYEENVKKWIESNNITGRVCRLEVSPQVEAFDPRAPSALDDPTFFVRQQYRDLEGREPTDPELAAWVLHVTPCGRDASCRSKSAAELFPSTRFYKDGSFTLGLYLVGLGRMPRYDEFTRDLTVLTSSAQNSGADARNTMAEGFTLRSDFSARYEGLSDMDYQTKLYETARLQSYSILPFDDQDSRGTMLRHIVESAQMSRHLHNAQWVLLHYFGYLRRDPDERGFRGWLDMLNATGDFGRVNAGFVNSPEYRVRVLQEPQ